VSRDRPTIQKKVNVDKTGLGSVNRQIERIIAETLRNASTDIMREGEKAVNSMIRLLAKDGGSIKMMGSSISVKPAQKLLSGPLGRLLVDKALVGGLGIPNPKEALTQLQNSLPQAIDARINITKDSITIVARFNTERLIKLNPHPGKTFPNGKKIPVDSWLQWTVGPRFDRSGTPGFGVANVDEIVGGANTNDPRSIQIRDNIARSSRTLGFSGDDAGIMFSTRPGRGGMSQFERFTGRPNNDWTPDSLGRDFWTKWWKANSDVIKDTFARIAEVAMDKVLSKQLGG
jgi:hypothetical protein